MISDTEKLQQARQLIGEKKYDQARAILQAMPDNATAQDWLQKLDQVASPGDDASTRAKLLKVRELVQQQRYDEARAILMQISDHPKAQEWLAQLDQVAPQPAVPASDDVDYFTPLTLPAEEENDDLLREEALGKKQKSARQLPNIQFDQIGHQILDWFEAVNLDRHLALLVLIVAAVSGIVAALLDGILGLPYNAINFTFGWLVTAFGALTYPVFTGRIDRAGFLMSLAVGMLTMFSWFIPAWLMTGDPSAGSASARNIYKFWFDEQMNLLKAMLTGLFLGPVAFGWYALLPVVRNRFADKIPALIEKIQALYPQPPDEE